MPQGPAAAQLSPDIEELPRLTAWHAVPLITGLSKRSTKHRAQDLREDSQQRPSVALMAHISCRVSQHRYRQGLEELGRCLLRLHMTCSSLCAAQARGYSAICLPRHHQLWPPSSQQMPPAVCSHHWTSRGHAMPAEYPLDGANILRLLSSQNMLHRYVWLTVPIPQPNVITPIALAWFVASQLSAISVLTALQQGICVGPHQLSTALLHQVQLHA